MGRLRLLWLVLASSCKATQPPPAEPAPLTTVMTVQGDADEPSEEPSPDIVLSTTSMHRELAWFVELLGKRKGVVEPAELEQHYDRFKPALTPSVQKFLREWGAKADGAIVESLEVDDPSYVRAILATGSKRWRLILEISESSNKIVFVQLEDFPSR